MFDYGGAVPARHILGNYELFEEVGRGGMGIVYRALDLSLDRIVAVKVLRDDLRAQPQIVSRFSREAKAAACLDHPNIVQIYSVGNEDDTPFIAMEFIDAVPLSTLMQRESCLSCDQALDIASQVASALACAHEAHVIHRDIKPPNILITDAGKAYVTDFGIAKILTMDDNLTVDGSRLGTPHYMSPERCKNGELTGSSDLYSLGVLLFQMLSGRLPYEAGSSVELIRKIVSDPPTRLRRHRGDLLEEVERLVAWIIEKQPKHRPADGHMVVEAIQRVRQGEALDTGNGAMSTVLADFRRSFGKRPAAETPLDTPHKLASGLTPITEVLPESWRKPIVRGAILTAAIAFAIMGFLWIGGGNDGATGIWDPDLANPQRWFADATVARFQDEAPGVVLAPLNLPAFAIDDVTWAGHPGTFLIQLSETSKAHHEGRRVVCGIDPVRRYASIVVPFGLSPSRTAGAPQTAAFAFANTYHGGSPLSSRPVMATILPMTHTPALVEGPFQTGEPIVLARLQAAASETIATVAMHPDGAHLATAIIDAQDRTSIVEWTRNPDGDFERGRTLAPPGPAIDALQYSATGTFLAFLRGDSEETQSLWLFPTDGTPRTGEPVAQGTINLSARAFSPDGTLLAVSVSGADGRTAVRLIRTGDRQVDRDLGAGWSVAWHPSGTMLVGTAPDRKNLTQVWAFEANAPYRRVQLTYLDGGTGRACALSGDGAWAASVRPGMADPVVVLAGTTSAGF